LIGRILDVALDLRRGSPTFGRHVTVELSAESGCQVYIPRCFAHGYITLAQYTIVGYKVDDEYAPDLEGGIAWNDPELKNIPRLNFMSDASRRRPERAGSRSPAASRIKREPSWVERLG